MVRQIAFSIRGLSFIEFQQILEKIAKKVYKKTDNLPTIYDKTEAFYIHILGIDVRENYKAILETKVKEREMLKQR